MKVFSEPISTKGLAENIQSDDLKTSQKVLEYLTFGPQRLEMNEKISFSSG